MSIVNTHYGYCGGSKAPKFTYTGTYNARKDGVVELLTSGTITFLNSAVIDLFLVGGGGRGAYPASVYNRPSGKGGGGGGYTQTIKKVKVAANQSFSVTIGAGSVSNFEPGGSTTFGDYSVKGGESGAMENNSDTAAGGPGAKGGSGGGAGVTSRSDYGAGGSDGGDGENSSNTTTNGGTGQGSTTREFEEANGKLYAGGGGGGRYMISTTPVVSPGGAGGGGNGGWVGEDGKGLYQTAGAGGENTGGGGGGGARNIRKKNIAEEFIAPGPGGSGIACFRTAK